MKFLLPIFLVAVAVVISTIADILLKKSQLQNHSLVLLGAVLYAVAALPVAAAFKLIDFSLVFFIWEAVAIILGLVLGIVMFKESFSVLKFSAFVFALTSLVLSYLGSK